MYCFFFQAEDGIRDLVRSRGLGDVYKRQPRIGGIGALTPRSSLPVARYWYRRSLEQAQHPKNTIESYLYDLAIFEQVIGPKPIDEVTSRDIAHYLGEANTRSTRKRRLTSVSQLCLLYTSDAADERSSVDLGGRRIIKKKTNKHTRQGSISANQRTDK